jgi:Skp family chaperone for outer membrane proteins
VKRAPRHRWLVLVLVIALALPAPGAAQGQAQSPPTLPPFLLLNQERILTGSRTGQAILAEEEAARDALRAEVREIDARFEAEERRLTELRATMEPDAFRALADAFDERVVEARRLQDERSNALVLEFDRRRRQFYSDVAPILVGLLSRYQAHAILDESTVLLADQSLNVTDAVIAEIDARFGPGEDPAEDPDAPDAEPEPEPEPAPDAGPDAPGGEPETPQE